MQNHPYPRLVEAVRALGASHAQRAKVLGRGRATIGDYLAGRAIPDRETIARHPLLLEAFCRDARERLAHNNAPNPSAEA